MTGTDSPLVLIAFVAYCSPFKIKGAPSDVQTLISYSILLISTGYLCIIERNLKAKYVVLKVYNLHLCDKGLPIPTEDLIVFARFVFS